MVKKKINASWYGSSTQVNTEHCSSFKLARKLERLDSECHVILFANPRVEDAAQALKLGETSDKCYHMDNLAKDINLANTPSKINDESQEKRESCVDKTVESDAPFIIKEGAAEIVVLSSKNVFYNPVQEFNRDLSVAVLTLFSEDHNNNISNGRRKQTDKTLEEQPKNSDLAKTLIAGVKYENGLNILEALSASGLRSIRYAKEVPGLNSIVANDISEAAVTSIRANIAHNDVNHLVTASHSDAVLVMYQHRRYQDRFHAVDLDPYGCPSHFLDAAVQCVSDGGVLLVTCTDMAVLCGNTPETCYSKYGSISLKNKACHEMALRILLQCIESHANRYSRYIVPLLSVSADFYIRVFVKIYTSAAICKESISKLSYVYQCVGCETMTLQPLGLCNKIGSKPSQTKFVLPHGPPVDALCQHCGHKHRIGGPIWSGPLHDTDFVVRLSTHIHTSTFGTLRRMEGVLAVISEELNDVPLYYTMDRLCSIVRCQTMSILSVRSAVLNAGYRVSYSHANRMSIKTDAPMYVLWDIVRYWESQNPIKIERRQNVSEAILSKKQTIKVDMTVREDANPESRQLKLVRFQENPLRYWGPGTRSTTCVQENKEEKRIANQGKKKKKRKPDLSPEKQETFKISKQDDKDM
uniref:tRNA (guanine(26)-N(2))-dimethyltransferase n=1 Tax=Timema bartmani TaxID=61472 RepID=A0A7R9F243_9NEOP|nr:unnamed protein product [Timema bartmani]